jgi:hypothetical protein
MPETTQDDVVHTRTGGNAVIARPVVEETVGVNGGTAKMVRSGVEEDSVGEGGRKGRVFNAAVEKRLAEILWLPLYSLPASGMATQVLPIPKDPALSGAFFSAQALQTLPASPLPLLRSTGLAISLER